MKNKTRIVYQDEHYTLGEDEGIPYLIADGKTYKLSCHPYEPCLYITDESGFKTAVHNAFDPSSVLWSFRNGRTITSITGFEYDAKDFCRMVEYASDLVNAGIDDAEKVFGGRAKKKDPGPRAEIKGEEHSVDGPKVRPEADKIIEDASFNDLISSYPDIVIDYCLVKSEHLCHGYNEHWMALVWACNRLFVDDDGEVMWHFDVGKGDAHQISAEELFAPIDEKGKLNYRTAFLRPPHENNYKDVDFDRVNAKLFPNGTDDLEIFEWTTDWSDYFDEGREWWGTLCFTVLDKTCDRFVVIMASATD